MENTQAPIQKSPLNVLNPPEFQEIDTISFLCNVTRNWESIADFYKNISSNWQCIYEALSKKVTDTWYIGYVFL